jgi:hypothetical protein
MPLFDVDVDGLKQTIAHEAPRVMLEPVSNALDTAAQQVLVRFHWRRGIAEFVVEDDDPTGFSSLTDAYTLFAPSSRKADPNSRGRFGFGEKEFIALAYPGPVTIRSTTGAVTFDGKTRSETRAARACRARGSSVEARIRLDREDAEAFVQRLKTILVPDGVSLTLDLAEGTLILSPRPALRSVVATLPTVLADADGTLRPTRRQTTVSVHAVLDGETPMLYELGVPVVASDVPWHLNVHQKVPLSRGRDTVTPAFLRTLHAAVLEVTADLLDQQAARASWVHQGLADVSAPVLRQVVHLIHGADAVIADPSHPEETKRAVHEGRHVVYGGSFSKEVWQAIRTHDVLPPAGDVPELRRSVDVSASGTPAIPEAEWRPEWARVVRYARRLAPELAGREVTVSCYRVPVNAAASCGQGGHLSFYVQNLPGSFWSNEVQVDDLLLHEFAHLRVSDHLSDAFHTECTRLGARLRHCRTRLMDA